MAVNILDTVRPCNIDEPDMLIVHCPRTVSVMPWDDLSRRFVEDQQRAGWIAVREPDALHLITPMHPALRM